MAHKILVIDDEEIIRRRLKDLLTSDGYETFTADSGNAGMEVFRKEYPDIVLTDINMPGMNGIEVLIEIKKVSPSTEVIIITGHGSMDTAIEALRQNAFDYITKPVNYDELLVAIKMALEKQRLSSENRRMREEKIKSEAEDKFRIIFDGANDGMIVADPESKRFSMVNKRICQMLGYSQDEMLNLAVGDIHPQESMALVIDQFEKQLREEIEIATLPVKRKDGTIFYADINAKPITISGEKQMLGIFRDVTERKDAENYCQRERQRLFDILEVMPMMVCLLTPDYHVAFANRAFREKFGELRGRHCYDYCFGKKEPCDFCQTYQVLKTGKPHRWEITDPDNSTVIDAYAFPFTDTGGSPMILEIDIDITEQKRMEKKLLNNQSQLFQTGKLAILGEMSAGLAHEMNQPLNGITLTAQSLRKLMERNSLTDKELAVALKDIENSIERMSKTIHHIRIFARQDTFKFAPVNVNESIENALSLLNEQLRLHNIKLLKECSDNLPPVMGETYQIEQVIINVISNARDALDEKGKKNPENYRKELKIKTSGIKDEVCIAISDNGIGMTNEEKEKIFDPFFTTKEVGKATGLGMSISHGIVEAHKGRIEVESKKGEGATIRIFLPINEQHHKKDHDG